MSKDFEGLSKIVPKISNPYNLTAFALVVIGIVLVNVEDINSDQKTLLLSIFLVGVFVILGILKPNQQESVSNEIVEDQENYLLGIRALIDSSTLPLYLTDKNLKVIYCNTDFAHLMDFNKEEIIGKTIEQLRPLFSLRVHEQVREKFDRDQDYLMSENRRKTPLHAGYETIIDNSKLHEKKYDRLYRLLIHYDMITYGPNSKILGALVNFDLDDLDESELPKAIDEVLSKKYIDE